MCKTKAPGPRGAEREPEEGPVDDPRGQVAAQDPVRRELVGGGPIGPYIKGTGFGGGEGGGMSGRLAN